jgi:hypothetical protein
MQERSVPTPGRPEDASLAEPALRIERRRYGVRTAAWIAEPPCPRAARAEPPPPCNRATDSSSTVRAVPVERRLSHRQHATWQSGAWRFRGTRSLRQRFHSLPHRAIPPRYKSQPRTRWPQADLYLVASAAAGSRRADGATASSPADAQQVLADDTVLRTASTVARGTQCAFTAYSVRSGRMRCHVPTCSMHQALL